MLPSPTELQVEKQITQLYPQVQTAVEKIYDTTLDGNGEEIDPIQILEKVGTIKLHTPLPLQELIQLYPSLELLLKSHSPLQDNYDPSSNWLNPKVSSLGCSVNPNDESAKVFARIRSNFNESFPNMITSRTIYIYVGERYGTTWKMDTPFDSIQCICSNNHRYSDMIPSAVNSLLELINTEVGKPENSQYSYFRS